MCQHVLHIQSGISNEIYVYLIKGIAGNGNYYLLKFFLQQKPLCRAPGNLQNYSKKLRGINYVQDQDEMGKDGKNI